MLKLAELRIEMAKNELLRKIDAEETAKQKKKIIKLNSEGEG